MFRVYALSELDRIAKQKKAVVVPFFKPYSKPKPAAWIINLSGVQLLQLFDIGMYIYERKEKKL